jgi:uncharacterized protein (TIGR02646 family)
VIAIQKGPAPPDLVRSGEEHVKELCAAYDRDPEPYRSGEREMAIRKGIYSAVKTELEDRHHGKCCYCETRINDHKPHADSFVEHWRPKRSSRQARGGKRIRPGYYWLAYDWDNLLLSCLFCNRQKNDLFPLANPASRATHHGMRIEDEIPEILKPDGDQDPRAHIRFDGYTPVWRTPLGRQTIEVLKLDSEAHGPRLTHLRKLEKSRQLAISLAASDDAKLREDAEGFRRFVVDAVKADQPYSSMAADFLEKCPFPADSA